MEIHWAWFVTRCGLWCAMAGFGTAIAYGGCWALMAYLSKLCRPLVIIGLVYLQRNQGEGVCYSEPFHMFVGLQVTNVPTPLGESEFRGESGLRGRPRTVFASTLVATGQYISTL